MTIIRTEVFLLISNSHGFSTYESTVFLPVIGKYIVFISERIVNELPHTANFFLSQNICGFVRL